MVSLFPCSCLLPQKALRLHPWRASGVVKVPMLLLAVRRTLAFSSLARLFPEKLLVMSNQVDSAHPYFVSLSRPVDGVMCDGSVCTT